MPKPFTHYRSNDFSGCADSFAGQGVCSLCGQNTAEYARSKKAYCLDCTKRQLTKRQKMLFELALNDLQGLVSTTIQEDFKALESLVKLGLMEKVSTDSYNQEKEPQVSIFKVK